MAISLAIRSREILLNPYWHYMGHSRRHRRRDANPMAVSSHWRRLSRIASDVQRITSPSFLKKVRLSSIRTRIISWLTHQAIWSRKLRTRGCYLSAFPHHPMTSLVLAFPSQLIHRSLWWISLRSLTGCWSCRIISQLEGLANRDFGAFSNAQLLQFI
jgi:hypothetical protein